MMIGGVVEIVFGINAEGKSLESVTKPLTSATTPDGCRDAAGYAHRDDGHDRGRRWRRAAETSVVYAAGAASRGSCWSRFRRRARSSPTPTEYDLSNTQYGVLFLPQVVTAIAASLLGAWLARPLRHEARLPRRARRRPRLDGAAHHQPFFEIDTSVAYPLLLLATAFLGAGFGLTVPDAEHAHRRVPPGRASTRRCSSLNALLGLGTALAPVFVAIFVGLGFWWGLPVLSAVLLVGLLGVQPAACRCARRRRRRCATSERRGIPTRFWLFAGFAVLYGICETVNGNWSQLDMTRELGASTTMAALALTAFWAMVTVGRIVVRRDRALAPGRGLTYRVLPFVLAGDVRAHRARCPTATPALGVVAFGARRARVLGPAAADDQLRPGAAAPRSPRRSPAASSPSTSSGTGSPRSASARCSTAASSLSSIYAVTAAVAVAMGLLSFAVTRRVVRGRGPGRLNTSA